MKNPILLLLLSLCCFSTTLLWGQRTRRQAKPVITCNFASDNKHLTTIDIDVRACLKKNGNRTPSPTQPYYLFRGASRNTINTLHTELTTPTSAYVFPEKTTSWFGISTDRNLENIFMVDVGSTRLPPAAPEPIILSEPNFQQDTLLFKWELNNLSDTLIQNQNMELHLKDPLNNRDTIVESIPIDAVPPRSSREQIHRSYLDKATRQGFTQFYLQFGTHRSRVFDFPN